MKKSIVALLALGAMSVGSSQAALVAHYTFDGTFDDASGFGNNGSPVNGASLSADAAPGFAGVQSLFLTDGQQHVLVPHNDSLNMTETLTVTAWVKTQGNAWEGLLAKNPSDGSLLNHAGNYEVRIENVSNQLNFLYQRGGDNDTATPISNTPLAVVGANEWIHVAVSVEQIGDTPGEVKYYTNGVLADTKPIEVGFGATNTNPLYIGSRADLFTQFNGNIDDLRIYNTVLSQGEIAATMAVPEPSTGVLALLGTLLVGFRRKR